MENDSMNNAYRGNGGPDRHRRYGSGREHHSRPSSGPYDRPGSQRPRESRPRRLEDAIETDELLSQDSFARYVVDGESQGEAAYQDYLCRHRRAALERYFARHKNEGWFKERYDPFSAEMGFNKAQEEVQARATTFVELAESGSFQGLALDDGEDLRVDGEKVSIEGLRSFPTSMNLPDRLRAAAVRKANMVTLSNISPQVSHEELVKILGEVSEGFISVETGLPIPEKGNYRMGWATFEDQADLAPIVAAIEEKILHGDKIYCSAQKSFSLQIKLVGNVFADEERVGKDLALAKDLMRGLEAFAGITSPLSDELLSTLSEKNQLDLILLYLRRVFFLCYYSGVCGASYQDLCRLTGDICVRSNDATAGGEVDFELFEQSIADLKTRLITSYEPFSEDSLLEKHVAKVDEGRYRCVHCSKLFKGPDFVVKHLRLKHEDVAKTASLEVATLNSFLARPILNAVLSLTGRRRKSSSNLEKPPRDGHHQDRRYARDHRGGPGSRRNPPPPPKDAAQDPRRLRQYVDWDAPATGDMEINYE